MRDQIVQAAVMLFALNGISRTSVDHICLAAGCSKGGLYHHFNGKQAIVAAAVRRLEASKALLPPFEASEDELLPGTNGLGRVLIEVWSAAAKDEALREQLSTAAEGYREAAGSRTEEVVRQLLYIGALVERMTRESITDAPEAASRLGIGRAA